MSANDIKGLNTELKNLKKSIDKLQTSQLSSLSSSLDSMQGIFRGLGIELNDSQTNFLNLASSLARFSDSFTKFANGLKDKNGSLAGTINTKWDSIKNTLSSSWDSIKNTLSSSWDSIKNTFNNFTNKFRNDSNQISEANAQIGSSATDSSREVERASGKATTAINKQSAASRDLTRDTGLAKKGLIKKNAVLGLKAIGVGLVTAAKVIWGIVKAALGLAAFAALLALIGPLFDLIGGAIQGAIRWFRNIGQETTESGKSIRDLAEAYGTTTEQIEADMERMGTTSIQVWQDIADASKYFADRFGLDSDEVMEQLMDLTAHFEGNGEKAERAFEYLAEASGAFSEQFGVDSGVILEELLALTKGYAENEQAAREAWYNIKTAANELADEFVMCADTIREELLELTKKYGDHEKAVESWRASQIESLTYLGSAWGMHGEEVREHMQELGMSAEEWAAHMGASWEQFNNDVQSNVSGIINGFREIPSEFSKTSEELREIMRNNTEITRQWQENMADLASPEMLSHLESMGPEFNSVIEEMLNSPEELAAWKETFDDASAVAIDGALANLEDERLQNAFRYKLDDTAREISENSAMYDALEENLKEVIDNAVEVVEEGGSEIAQSLEESFIERFEEGDYSIIPETIAEAIEEGHDTIVEPVQTAIDTMISIVEEGLESVRETATNSFEAIGETMTGGMENASSIVESGVDEIEELVSSSFESVVETTVETMDSLNETFDEGFANAVLTSEEANEGILASFENLASSMLGIGVSAMQGLMDGLASKKGALMAKEEAIIYFQSYPTKSPIQGSLYMRDKAA